MKATIVIPVTLSIKHLRWRNCNCIAWHDHLIGAAIFGAVLVKLSEGSTSDILEKS